MIDDSEHRYGWVTRLLHWTMAVLILVQAGKIADRINDGENLVSALTGPWHTSIGTLLFVLVFIRLAWTSHQRANRPTNPGFLGFVAKAGHWALYALTIVLPIAGMLILYGGGYGHAPFGIPLFGKGPEVEWASNIGSAHSPLALLFVLVVLGHAGAALYHHFIRRDGVLRRML